MPCSSPCAAARRWPGSWSEEPPLSEAAPPGPGPDWNAPWLVEYRAAGLALQQRLEAGQTVAQALNALVDEQPAEARPQVRGQVLRFVPQAALDEGQGYECFIAREAAVPTREHWHDALNGLVWLRWPALKARLNALHQQGLQTAQEDGRRGPLRDALTLFDENGAWLQAPPALGQALQARDWRRLFIELRPLWSQARLHLVGHALMEKLMQPRTPICAHVLLQDPLSLDAAGWAGKPFAPLPVLGVPGWWPANAEAGFYDDVRVFRPPVSSGTGPAMQLASRQSQARESL